MLEIPVSKLREVSGLTMNPDGTVELQSINYSALDMYLRCPAQFKFRYIDGKKSPPSIAMTEGTSHHKAAEEDNKSKKEKGKQLKPSQMVEIFASTWEEELKKAVKEADELKTSLDWQEDDNDSVLNRGKVLQTKYANAVSHLIKPEDVEAPFMQDVDVNGVKFRLHGQMDVTTVDTVLDYKTAARPKTDKDTENSLQLSLYSWINKKPKVSFVTFVKAKDPYVQAPEPVKVTPGRWLWALEVVASAVDGIRRGSFPKTNPAMFPAPWWCSERFCGFWKQCRGKYE